METDTSETRFFGGRESIVSSPGTSIEKLECEGGGKVRRGIQSDMGRKARRAGFASREGREGKRFAEKGKCLVILKSGWWLTSSPSSWNRLGGGRKRRS